MDILLKRYLHKLAEEVRQKPYDYWTKQQSTIAYEEVYEGQETQVEVFVLQVTPQYVHVAINASISPLGWWDHEGIDVFIDKKE